MIRTATLCLLLALVAGAASAQVFFYDFKTDPVGTSLNSIWKEDRGDWSVSSLGGQHWLQSQITSAWQYATAPGLQFKDCCVQCDVGHPGSNLVFGGVALRCLKPTGGSLGQDLLMAKMQGSSGLNGVWLYTFSPTGSQVVNSSTYTSTKRGTIRLLTIGTSALCQVDANGDDRWDAQVRVKMTWTPQVGPVGFCGYNGAVMDKFRLWDGVCVNDPAGPSPTPGNVIQFKLVGSPSRMYQAATALGNSGLLLPNVTVLPLSPDHLFSASVTNVLPTVFQNYRGVMKSNGEATIKLALPNIAALKGVMLYTAFVNLRSPTILNVSNDARTLIQ